MTNRRLAAFAAAGALALGGTGVVVANQLSASGTPPPGCEFPEIGTNAPACFAAGAIRNVFFHNIQGAGQFCKWKAANPGEWTAVLTYSETQQVGHVKTWMGAALFNALDSYFATGGGEFQIMPNTAPDVCKTPTLRSPVIAGVTPTPTTATVTIDPNG